MARGLLAIRRRLPSVALFVDAYSAANPALRPRPARMVINVPVLPVQDAAAVTLAAATVTTLRHIQRLPGQAGVMIAGAQMMPLLARLLAGVGIGEVMCWNTDDTTPATLVAAAAGAQVVIDLLAQSSHLAVSATRPSGPAVIVPDPVSDPLYALPGLVKALVNTPGVNPATYRARHNHMLAAAVLALARATPPRHARPPMPTRELATHIANAATRTLTPRDRSPAPIPRPPGRPPDPPAR